MPFTIACASHRNHQENNSAALGLRNPNYPSREPVETARCRSWIQHSRWGIFPGIWRLPTKPGLYFFRRSTKRGAESSRVYTRTYWKARRMPVSHFATDSLRPSAHPEEQRPYFHTSAKRRWRYYQGQKYAARNSGGRLCAGADCRSEAGCTRCVPCRVARHGEADR